MLKTRKYFMTTECYVHTRLFSYFPAELKTLRFANKEMKNFCVGRRKSFVGLRSSNRQFNELKLETNIMQSAFKLVKRDREALS